MGEPRIPKWLVDKGKSHLQIDDLEVTLFQETSIFPWKSWTSGFMHCSFREYVRMIQWLLMLLADCDVTRISRKATILSNRTSMFIGCKC